MVENVRLNPLRVSNLRGKWAVFPDLTEAGFKIA